MLITVTLFETYIDKVYNWYHDIHDFVDPANFSSI